MPQSIPDLQQVCSRGQYYAATTENKNTWNTNVHQKKKKKKETTW